MRTRGAALVLSLSLMILASTTQLPATRPIVIGVLAPLSGNAATFGASALKGIELALEERNAAGGLLGRPLQVATYDDQGDPARGARGALDLIDRQGASVIIGAIMSKVSLAAAPIAQLRKVPLVSPTSTNPRVTRVGSYIFRSCFIDPYQGVLAAAYAYRDLGSRRAAIVVDGTNDYCLGIADAFAAAFATLGGEVVARAPYLAQVGSLEASCRAALASGPDLVLCPNYDVDDATVALIVRDAGFEGPLLGGDGWDSPDLAGLARGSLRNCHFVNHWALEADTPANRAFVQGYRNRYGDDPDIIAAMGYEAALLVLGAMEKAGGTDGPAVAEALRALDLDLLLGRLSFDSQGDPRKPGVIMAVSATGSRYEATVLP